MDPVKRRQAEDLLTFVCRGRRVCGIFWSVVPTLILRSISEDSCAENLRGADEVEINLESSWTLFTEMPSEWPQSEEDLPRPDFVQLADVAVSLRDVDITKITLGVEAPHLVIWFADGRILFVNGHHEQYEPWNIYAEPFSVHTYPNDDIDWAVPEWYGKGV